MIDALNPSRKGAPGSINVSTINGRLVPNFDNFEIDSTDRKHYYVGVHETKAPAGSGGQPRQYAAVARSVFRLDDGNITDDLTNFQSTHDEFNDIVQGTVICNGPPDGSQTSTTESGFVPILIVTFGTGNPNPDATSETGVYYRVLSTDSSTPWNECTAADTSFLTAWQIVKAGPDLYAACDAGRAGSLGDWRVSKCPVGNNPVLSASWGNGVEVGTPEWIINGLAAIGDSVVVGKPDGLYYYNTQTRRYENVLKHYELLPHALNGKVTESVSGGVVYTTYDGRAYFFDGVAVQEISPHKLWDWVGRDIGSARITAVADRGDSIAMITDVPSFTTQRPGLLINKVTVSAGNETATDITSGIVDGDLNTGTGTALDSLASGSFIDIWANVPFEGVVMHVTRSPNSTITAVWDKIYYSSATDTFTEDTGGFYDGTKLLGNKTTATSGGSLSYVAFPPSASSGVVMAKSPNFGSLMTAINYDYDTGTDVTSKYGMRIRLSGTFDSDTELDEIEIIPWRRGMPNGGIYSSANNYTSRDRAGCIPHIYILKRQHTTGFVAHDSYAVSCGPGVWKMAYTSGRAGFSDGESMMGQSLVLWGRYATFIIPEGTTRDPARTPYPSLSYVNAANPSPLVQVAHEWRGKGSEVMKMKKLKMIYIDTQLLRPGDVTELFMQHDGRDIISLGKYEGGPLAIPVDQAPFRMMNLWLGMSLSHSTSRHDAPQYMEPIVVEYDVEGEMGAWQQDLAISIPDPT